MLLHAGFVVFWRPQQYADRVQREARLDHALRVLLGRRAPADDGDGDPFTLALAAFDRLCSDDIESGAGLAAEALEHAADPDARALARAVAGLAVACWPPAHESFVDPLQSALDDPAELSPQLAPVLCSLLAEAALACARLDLAIAFAERAGEPPSELFGSAEHPYLTFLRTSLSRTLAFRGDIAGAERWAAIAIARANSPTEVLLARGTAALVRGNADARRDTQALVDEVAESGLAPIGIVARGCYVLASYGAIAIGDLDRAAQLMLVAGGDADASYLRIIDRILGFEMLVAVAVEAGDVVAAEAWQSRAAALRSHPIAESTVLRIDSRVAYVRGDGEAAIEAAERAIARARADGRAVEEAEGEIILARARILADRRGEAARGLAHAASSADESGHLAVRRAASRELRRVGRRLPPASSSGWRGLTDREREVAALLVTGASNAELAKTLYLSEHTVRMHVSRVLQAFGVATRSGVAAVLGSTLSEPSARTLPRHEVPPALTPRQRDIVDGLVAGCSNRQLAQELGITEATVEKHVSAILVRWGVASRAGIVGMAVAARAGNTPG